MTIAGVQNESPRVPLWYGDYFKLKVTETCIEGPLLCQFTSSTSLKVPPKRHS